MAPAARVLVTGAGGFVGSHVVTALASVGYGVVRIGRTDHGGSDFAKDIGPCTTWDDALDGVNFVVHAAGIAHATNRQAGDYHRVNAAGTRRLAEEAARAGVERLVFLSSIGVHGGSSAEPVSEISPLVLDSPYVSSKLDAEIALAAVADSTNLETVVLRPSLVYGPSAPGSMARLASLLDRRVPLPFRSVTNRRSFLYVENLVDLIAMCLTHPSASGRTFVVSDAEALSTRELIEALCEIRGDSPRLFPAPVWALRLGAAAIGRAADAERLLGSMDVNIGRVEAELGWKPPHRTQHGLEQSYRLSLADPVGE